ncbi:MAG: hypothetical protein WA126_05715 [Thermodesulfovibrionales bacterium]
MKRFICLICFVLLLLTFFSLNNANAAMTDYCVVPPYVIQDVPPNVMIILDNSNSMYNLAYACTTTTVTTAGTNTTVIPVDNVTGFKVRQWIALVHGATTYQLQISAINTVNKTLTVTASVPNFSVNDAVLDWGCYGECSATSYPRFYDNCYTCDSTYATSTQTGVTQINVNSIANFWVGEIIAIASSGGPHERVITAISPSDRKITVNSSVTVAINDKIYDYNCYYLKHPYPEQSFDSTKEYYGYFLPTYLYTYDSSGGRFVTSRLKTAGAKTPGDGLWDGNFMNWLTMRRVDIVRKVMTGGKTTTSNRLVTTSPEQDRRGLYKAVFNAENYMGCTGCIGNINVTFPTASSDPSSFTAYSGPGNPSSGWTSRGSFNLYVVVPTALVPVSGVLQDVVGTRARLGLTFYSTSTDGGFVQVAIAASNLASAVTQINNTNPSTNTPIGETLWTVGGYFAQESSIPPVGTPGPRYASGDYQISNNVDPLNFGTGGSPRWPSCAKSYVLLITDGEPCSDGNLPGSFATYASTRTSFNCSGSTCPKYPSTCTDGIDCLFNSSTLPSCGPGGYTSGLEDVALYLHTNDLRNNGGTPDIGKDAITGIQNLTLYTVFAFGKTSTFLQYASINGGFEDLNGNNQPDLQSEWDSNNDGVPDNYYEADEGNSLEQSIRNALSSILRRASSGTAASVLASGEGSGANLVQAVFYPRRRFGNDIISWTGESQNFWYYIDPFFKSSSIREDTVSDDVLNLTNDFIVSFYFDQTAQLTKARRFQDTDGDGDSDIQVVPPVIFENVSALWKAGQLLWSRDLSSDPRTIYTTTNGTSFLANYFTVANRTTLRPYLQAADDTEAEYIIRYTHGEGLTTLLDEDGLVVTPPGPGVDRDGDSVDDYRPRYARIGTDTHVWKLGDVLDSTPRIVSWVQLNNYDSRYNDETYKTFIQSSGYKNRGMVFAGGNDGMLHAFKLGNLELKWTGQGAYERARLTGSNKGREQWAFIPRNALPYLKYVLDPEYCHIFTVDLSPFIFDASTGLPGTGDISGNTRPSDASTWRTVLIGGMRSGGACRATSTVCTDVSGDGSKDCVNTPLDLSGSSIGYSSYFALDVTDQDNPQLLWEFSNDQLGFATTGPAVVRIGDKDNNGKWFVVFASGPTGPVDTTNQQFMGRSDQTLRLFLVDLKTGALLRTIDTGIQYAFAGSMINATLDVADITSNNITGLYNDDVVYIGYVKRAGSSPNYTWTDGGVGRLVTLDSVTGLESADVTKWTWSRVMDGIGAVTSSITKLENVKTHILWLYFGTGRYYYELGATPDDADSQRRLFGIKEPCFGTDNKLDKTCITTVSFGDLTNVTSLGSVPSETTANGSSFKGWYINLDASGTFSYCEIFNLDGSCAQSPVPSKAYRAERVITDPLATSSGLVFFTTYKPYSDECGLGGKSFIWATRYSTGGAPSAGLLKGVALLQVSTGSIEQKELSKAFTTSEPRKTAAMEGVPPTAQGLSLLSAPPPVKRVMHIRER